MEKKKTTSNSTKKKSDENSKKTSKKNEKNAKKKEITKEKNIKSQLTEYKKIYKNIDEKSAPFVKKLYTEAAFMYATLEELKKSINDEGAVKLGVNGNGFVVLTEHPAQKSYNAMIKNYMQIIKQLSELAPEIKAESKLDKFINM